MKTLKQLIKLYKNIVNPVTQGNNRLILYAAALDCLGKDASPQDVAPDEVGCAETVYDILASAFPLKVGFSLEISTSKLYDALKVSKKFIKIDQPLQGDIVISPTGYGNGKLSNGHVGIKGEDDVIMSNDSATGLFLENYTVTTWKKRYVTLGGYPMLYFRRI